MRALKQLAAIALGLLFAFLVLSSAIGIVRAGLEGEPLLVVIYALVLAGCGWVWYRTGRRQ
jgi:membrane protease YdiL (CAAX protease family)